MERHALGMYTSCGWFFDDIGGLETIVCLRYAARAIELAGPEAMDLETALRERLALAESNDPAVGSGRDLYDRSAKPAHPGHVRAAAGYAAVLALAPERVRSVVGAYLVGSDDDGGLAVRHRRTGRSWLVTAAVHRMTRIAITVELRVEEDASLHRVAFAELPEPEREQVRLVLRQEVREGILSPEDERRISEGLVRYERALAEAVIRQLPANPSEADGLDLDRLSRSLDLLALEEQPVPFDAQTRVYRLMTQGPLRTRRALQPLLGRFGFAPSAEAHSPE